MLANKGGIEEKQLSEFVYNNYRHGNYCETNHETKWYFPVAVWVNNSDTILFVYDATQWKLIINIHDETKVLQMMEIELELTSNSKDVTEILEKVSQLVKDHRN